jgi:hypothetical protein
VSDCPDQGTDPTLIVDTVCRRSIKIVQTMINTVDERPFADMINRVILPLETLTDHDR